MGHTAIYRCKNCGNEFPSQEGGGFIFAEYRCVDCDTIKIVNRSDLSSTKLLKEKIGICEKCGGKLRDDIRPMCPSCKSRDVEEKEITTYYD